jgi:hypothetical protein
MSTDSLQFEELCLPIPKIVYTFSEEKQKEIYEYLSQLDEHQKKAYRIAYQHLGTSFNIYKSNGYKEWKNKFQ